MQVVVPGGGLTTDALPAAWVMDLRQRRAAKALRYADVCRRPSNKCSERVAEAAKVYFDHTNKGQKVYAPDLAIECYRL